MEVQLADVDTTDVSIISAVEPERDEGLPALILEFERIQNIKYWEQF